MKTKKQKEYLQKVGELLSKLQIKIESLEDKEIVDVLNEIPAYGEAMRELQKREILDKIEKEIKQTQGDLARSKQWIDEVKVKYQQYSKMFDDFKASDDGEMSAALEQYNLESGYLNALNYLKQKLTK